MRRLAGLFVALAALSCSDREPSAPARWAPRAQIFDGAHIAGNARFYFLPPLVPAPTTSGTFDATLKPVVQICTLGTSGCLTPLVAEYTMTSGPGSETVRVNPADQNYVVNWSTDQFLLDPAKTYRIQVLVSGTILGFADVDVVETSKEVKSVLTGQFIGLVNGTTLPIKFRIEEGAVFVLGPAGGTINALGGRVRLDFPPGALARDIGVTVQVPTMYPPDPTLVGDSPVIFGPENTQFAVPVTVRIGYDPARIPLGVGEASLRLHKLFGARWSEISGSHVDLTSHVVTGPTLTFSTLSVAQGGIQFNQMVLPAGFPRTNFTGVWGNSESDAFAISDSGIIHFDGMGWRSQTCGGHSRMKAAWGSGPNDVFAVGDWMAIVHFDGGRWRTQACGGASDTFNLVGVWGTGPSDVFAIGRPYNIVHYDGVKWARQALPYAAGSLTGIWGNASDNVYVVDDNGEILHFDGASWKVQPSVARALKGIWGSSATDVFAVGFSCTFNPFSCFGVILHYDGAAWSLAPNVPSAFVNGIWGSSSSDVFAVGEAGTLLHFDGLSWNVQPSPTNVALNGVWGGGPGAVFAVGDQGTILHFDGTNWSSQASGTTESLLSVWGSSATDLYALGLEGVLLHYNGSAWSTVSIGQLSTVPARLRAVRGLSSSNVWAAGGIDHQDCAVGYENVDAVWAVLIRYDGMAWSPPGPSRCRIGFRGIWVGKTSMVAVGTTHELLGVVWRFAGPDVAQELGQDYVGAGPGLLDVWMSADETAQFAVGLQGTILHRVGHSWTRMSSGVSTALHSVWGSGPTDVFTVGDGGVILHYNGFSWSPQPSGTTLGLNGVWGTSPIDVFASGAQGTILHYDGISWQRLDPGINYFPTNPDLGKIWANQTDVFAVGQGGLILHGVR